MRDQHWLDSASREALIEEIAWLENEIDAYERRTDEQECRRCHRTFRGLPEEQFCTRDCQMGWTPAPTYEEWYRGMHPRSPHLQKLVPFEMFLR